MKYDENEKMVKDALNTIHTPLYDFKKEVKEKIIVKQRPMLIRRKLNIGLVAIIIVILSGTVLASTLPSINRLFSIISPEMGKLLQPVDENIKKEGKQGRGDEGLINEAKEEKKEALGVISEGIEIKPMAVINDDDMMIIYLSIQDLMQNRVDETLSVGEYFVEGGTINNAQLIDYDKDSKTAIVQLTTQGGDKLNNSSIAVAIKSLITSKKEIEQLPIPINLSQIQEVADHETVQMGREDTQGGGGSGDMWNILEDIGWIKVLKGNRMQMEIPEVEGVTITNIGFIDKKLHIQTRWEDNDKNRRGYFYLTNQEGKKIKVKENNFYFDIDESNEIQFGRQYVEYILDISKEEVEDVQLQGYFAEDGEVIDGEWNLEISLDAVGEIISIPSDIWAETWRIKEVMLSPLGLTLKGEGTTSDKINCSIQMESGEVKQFDSVSSSNQGGDITMKFTMQTPLDLSAITVIQVGESIIDLR